MRTKKGFYCLMSSQPQRNSLTAYAAAGLVTSGNVLVTKNSRTVWRLPFAPVYRRPDYFIYDCRNIREIPQSLGKILANSRAQSPSVN